MDSAGIFSQQLSETLQQLKTRLELERYFSKDYLAKANLLNPTIDVPVYTDRKTMLINLLDQKVQTCVLCDLHKTRSNGMLGEGSLEAKLVFIGEDSGSPSDLLTKIINAMQINRSDVFITNVLRCQTANERDSSLEQAICCKPYLLELLEIIKPKVICTLGKFATHALLNQTTPIAQLRGKLFNFNGIKLIPTYHPAYLLKNPEDKKLVWDDMKKILNILKLDET